MTEFRQVRGHIEVFIDNEFQFSADTMSEAVRELREQKGENVIVQ